MAAVATATQNNITLKGSTKIVTEFFHYAVNSILFQRGVYPSEAFQTQKKYGLSMMVTTDGRLSKYLTNVLMQMEDWMLKGDLQKMVMVITSAASKEVLERWSFDIETDEAVKENSNTNYEKPESQIMSEIQAIIRQVTASITFLPLLDEKCTFDLLVYTDVSSDVPVEWEESDARMIKNSADVRLRSFSTRVHKVDTLVSYKADDDV